MTNKMSAGIGIALMALTAMVPMGLAHYDSGAHNDTVATPFATTGMVMDPNTSACLGVALASCLDPHTDATYPDMGNGGNRVSGWYFGAGGFYVQVRNGTDDPAILSAGAMFCDMEVLQAPGDENTVDGAAGGVLPDGIFNDGGAGGACHVGDQGYGAENNADGIDGTADDADNTYTTPGCAYETNAFAEDAVSGSEIWIATTCDSYSVSADPSDPGPTLDEVVVITALCLTNHVIGGTATIGSIADCADFLLDCLGLGTAPNSCAPSGGSSTINCGWDSSADDAEFGEGDGAGVDSNSALTLGTDDAENGAPTDGIDTDGVPFPSVHAECDEIHGSAGVFTYLSAAVAVDGTAVTVENVGVPTHGWIA